MIARKTHDQIVAEIDALRAVKLTVRKCNQFGDSNHEMIDAQIAVLNGLSHDDIYDAWGDESADEFSEELLDAALQAHDWRAGTQALSATSPSEGWR